MSRLRDEEYETLEAELEAGFARMLAPEEHGRAQDWVNWLDEAMEFLDVDSQLYIRSLHKLRDLCGRTGLVPKGYYLPDTIILESQDPVSHGGYSNVYQGIYNGLPVALKALRLMSSDRAKVDKSFCREVIVWKRLVHPNIVPFLGVSTLFPNCLVSPWMPHGSMRSYMEVNPDKDRSSWLFDTAKGLAYMHRLGLVHGDLKSANILLDQDLRACLTDFGLAALVYHTSGMTASSELGGSARWMAPELFKFDTPDQGRPTIRSDVYSLGVVWWELLTGKIPYHELYNDAQVIFKRLSGETLPEPEDVHPGLWRLILDCWAPDPLIRPSANQALDRIDHLPLSSPESPTTPWSFDLTYTAVPMPTENVIVLTSSPVSSSLYEEPEVIDIDVSEASTDDMVEEFKTTLDQMDQQESLSNVSSLSSSINIDSFTYDQDACSDKVTTKWHYSSPLSASSTDYAIAFGSREGFVRVWTMRTDTFDCQSFRSSSHGLLTLGLSPAGHVITAGNLYDPITRVWDLRSGTAVVHESPAQCSLRVDKILFSSDGAFVVKMGVYSNETASIEIWQTMPPKILSKVDTTDGQAAPKLIALSPNDDTLVTVDRQGDVSVYRISDGGTNLAHSATYTPHLDSPIDAVAFSASTDVRLLHLDWWSHTLQCATMDLATGLSRPVSLRNPAAASWRRPQVTCTAFSRNGNRVAVGFQGGHVQPYHAMNGDAIGQPLEHHGQPDKPAITAVAFAATSDCLFTTDAAGCCWLWHIPSGHAVIAFTPDGGVEHQDVAVLSRFREMVSTWRREQRGRKDSDATIMQPSADDV